MYNYRFDKNYRAINENPLAQFDTTYKGGVGGSNADQQAIYEARLKTLKDEAKTKTKTARNGAILKSLK